MLRRAFTTWTHLSRPSHLPPYSLVCRPTPLLRQYATTRSIINDDERQNSWLKDLWSHQKQFITWVHKAGKDFDLDVMRSSTDPHVEPEEAFVLAKRLSEAFNNEWSNIVCSRIMYSLAQEGEGTAHNAANLYIVKLSIPSPSAARNPLVKDAIERVKRMAKEGDFEAQTVYAELMVKKEQLADARDLFEAAHKQLPSVKLVRLKKSMMFKPKSNWQNSSNHTVTIADFEVAYAQFLLMAGGGRGVTDAESDALANSLLQSAAKQGHFEACVELVRASTGDQSEQYDWAYHDSLVKLAVSGHLDSAKRLGDIYSKDEEWRKLAPEIREHVEEPRKLSMLGFLPPKRYRRVHPTRDPEALWSSSYDILRCTWECQHEYLINRTAKESTTTLEANPKWTPDLDDRNFELRQDGEWRNSTDLTMLENFMEELVLENQTRFHRALEWYKFAGFGGHRPALAAGLRLSYDLWLPVERHAFGWGYINTQSHTRTRASPDEKVVGQLLDSRNSAVAAFNIKSWRVLGNAFDIMKYKSRDFSGEEQRQGKIMRLSCGYKMNP